MTASSVSGDEGRWGKHDVSLYFEELWLQLLGLSYTNSDISELKFWSAEKETHLKNNEWFH